MRYMKDDEKNEKSPKIDKTSKIKYNNLGGQYSTPALGNAFLDAHIIFEPLLSSLGLMPQQMTNLSLKNLGTQITVTVAVDTFQVFVTYLARSSSHRSVTR